MHNFCFTIPYGLLLVCSGVIGFAKKGSTASLAGGAGTGLLLILAGYLSLQAFHKRKNSYFALFLKLAIAALLTFVMGKRYAQSGKIMPAGIVAGIRRLKDGSAAMRSGESPISSRTPAPRELHTAWHGLAALMVVRCLTGASGAAHLAPTIGAAAEVMAFIFMFSNRC